MRLPRRAADIMEGVENSTARPSPKNRKGRLGGRGPGTRILQKAHKPRRQEVPARKAHGARRRRERRAPIQERQRECMRDPRKPTGKGIRAKTPKANGRNE